MGGFFGEPYFGSWTFYGGFDLFYVFWDIVSIESINFFDKKG